MTTNYRGRPLKLNLSQKWTTRLVCIYNHVFLPSCKADPIDPGTVCPMSLLVKQNCIELHFQFLTPHNWSVTSKHLPLSPPPSLFPPPSLPLSLPPPSSPLPPPPSLPLSLCAFRPSSALIYGFSEFACTLNEPEEGVAPTDSRLQPDQRVMEEGDFKRANKEKVSVRYMCSPFRASPCIYMACCLQCAVYNVLFYTQPCFTCLLYVANDGQDVYLFCMGCIS